MATEAFAFDVIAPPIVKKGESARVLICYPVAAGVSVEVYIKDPSGRQIPATIKTNAAIGGRTALSAHYFDFVFGSVGTYIIFVYVEVAPTPDIYTGACIVHVPAWLDYIDTPISDILKQAMQTSRLRTNIRQQGNKLTG
jgi:hypothetical protein